MMFASKNRLTEVRKVANTLKNNDNGGPGGRIQIIDFIGFFVGKNQKPSRIVPYGSATAAQANFG
jgi:hypothetical protein